MGWIILKPLSVWLILQPIILLTKYHSFFFSKLFLFLFCFDLPFAASQPGQELERIIAPGSMIR